MRLLALAGGLLVGAGVLVIDPAGWSPFGPAKWTAVVAAAIATVAVAAGQRDLFVVRRAGLAWLAFLAWLAVATVEGLDPRSGWLGAPQRHFGALTWVMCAALFVAGHGLHRPDAGQPRADAGRLLAGLAAGFGALAGIWSACELAGWHPVRLASSRRLTGPLGSAAYLGAAEALLAPMAFGLAADRGSSSRQRWVAALAGGWCVVGLVGSGARAAWAGAAVAALAVGWVLRRWLWDRSRRRRTIIGLAGAASAVVALAAVTGVAERVPQLVSGQGPGGASRLAEWRVAVRVVADHPLTGVGPEGYRIAFGSEVDAGYQRRYGTTPLPDRAHDVLLDVAVTTGIPGLLGYLALLGLVGSSVARALRRGAHDLMSPDGDPLTPAWMLGIAAGIVAYGVGELFLFPIAEIEPVVWLLAGLVSVRVAPRADLVRLQPPGSVRLLAQVAAGGALAGAVVLGTQAVAADRLVKRALQDSATGRLVGATAAADQAVRDDPGNIVVRLIAAETASAPGTLAGIDGGLARLAPAIRLSPRDPVLDDERASLLVERARITASPADWRTAVSFLTALRRADPENPQVLLQLGICDASVADWQQADAALERAAFLEPGSSAPRTDLAVVRAMEAADGTG